MKHLTHFFFNEKTWVVLVGSALALAVRYPLLTFKSNDYYGFTQWWYLNIKLNGFAVFGYDFANYTPLYLYLLYLSITLLPNVLDVVVIKIPAMLSDLVMAWFVGRSVAHCYGEKSLAAPISFVIILLTPTVFLNSAMWGQADSVFTAAIIACLYFLLKRREALACISFGIAFAIKLQAVFLAPCLLILVLKRYVSWQNLFFIPIVYTFSVIPSYFVGRPAYELVTIYAAQASQNSSLTLNAPTVYAWFPKASFNDLYYSALIFGGAICLLFVFLASRSHATLTPRLLIQLTLISVTLTPFVLPKMHERYFYPADIISVLYAFYFPKHFYLPLTIQFVSFFAYQPFLFNNTVLPMWQLAIIMMVVLITLTRHTWLTLYPVLPTASVPSQQEIV